MLAALALPLRRLAMSLDLTLDGITVLVVDDNRAVLDALVELLTTAGATVIAEESAEEALATLTRERPHVLLSDIAMPGHDGLWLINQVRRLPADQGGETPAIAVTGHVLGDDRCALLSAGFQGHLQKPVAFQDLVMSIRLVALRRRPSS